MSAGDTSVTHPAARAFNDPTSHETDHEKNYGDESKSDEAAHSLKLFTPTLLLPGKSNENPQKNENTLVDENAVLSHKGSNDQKGGGDVLSAAMMNGYGGNESKEGNNDVRVDISTHPKSIGERAVSLVNKVQVSTGGVISGMAERITNITLSNDAHTYSSPFAREPYTIDEQGRSVSVRSTTSTLSTDDVHAVPLEAVPEGDAAASSPTVPKPDAQSNEKQDEAIPSSHNTSDNALQPQSSLSHPPQNEAASSSSQSEPEPQSQDSAPQVNVFQRILGPSSNKRSTTAPSPSKPESRHIDHAISQSANVTQDVEGDDISTPTASRQQSGALAQQLRGVHYSNVPSKSPSSSNLASARGDYHDVAAAPGGVGGATEAAPPHSRQVSTSTNSTDTTSSHDRKKSLSQRMKSFFNPSKHKKDKSTDQLTPREIGQLDDTLQQPQQGRSRSPSPLGRLSRSLSRRKSGKHQPQEQQHQAQQGGEFQIPRVPSEVKRNVGKSLFVNDSSSSEIEENPVTDEEKRLLPEMRAELKKFLAGYNTLEGRAILSQNKATAGHWRDNYRRDDLPHLYALRDAALENRPYRRYTQDDLPPKEFAPWPVNVDDYPDRLLNRFLRARKHKIALAVEQLAKTLAWRSEYGVDELASLPYEPCHNALQGISSAEFHGTDKEGRPIFFNKSGVVNIEQFAKVMSDREIILTHVYSMEKVMRLMEESSRKRKKRVDKLVSAQDLDGLGIAHRKLAHNFTAITVIDATYYAETVHSIWIINCPSVFTSMWDYIIKPFIDPVTLKKTHIHGFKGWLSKMGDEWGIENVPREYGGKCNCENECMPLLTASHNSNKDNVHLLTNTLGESENHVQIKAGKRYIVQTQHGCKAKDAKYGKTIRYEFEVLEGGEIDFSIEWFDAMKHLSVAIRGNDGKHNDVLVPPKRITSKGGVQKGEYNIKSGQRGALSLCFSNQHSNWNSKVFRWSASVISDDPNT